MTDWFCTLRLDSWYEIFDNMYGGTARINGLPQGVDQDVRTEHEEVEILSDDEVLVAPTTTLLSPRSRACQNPHAPCQVNKSANKRKLTVGDLTIADAIKYGFDGVQESEKMKMQVTKEITSQILESEQQGRQLYFQSQLQMASLIVEAFKPKDTTGGSQ
jgi:hypothetical protein